MNLTQHQNILTRYLWEIYGQNTYMKHDVLTGLKYNKTCQFFTIQQLSSVFKMWKQSSVPDLDLDQFPDHARNNDQPKPNQQTPDHQTSEQLQEQPQKQLHDPYLV